MRRRQDVQPAVFYAFAARAALRGARASSPAAIRCTAALWLVLSFFTARGDLAAAAGRVPGHRAGAGLRRRGDGAVPLRRDDARRQLRQDARGIQELHSGRRDGRHADPGRDALVLLGGYSRPATGAAPAAAAAGYSNTRARAGCSTPITLYPFEIAAVILLVAIIAAIALTHAHAHGTKYQDPAAQVKVRARRLRVLDMPAEKNERWRFEGRCGTAAGDAGVRAGLAATDADALPGLGRDPVRASA